MTENDIKQQLINYLASVKIQDKSKRQYSPSEKAIANFELSIALNNQQINIYTFINKYNQLLKSFEILVKYRLNTNFKWTGKINNPKITTHINQTQTNRVCLFVGFMTHKLQQYIPELTYTLTILK